MWIRLAVGAAGAALAVSGFLPWSESEGVEATGWETSAGPAVLALLTGLVAIAAAATGGRIGLFRPDVSLRGAADILALVTTAVVVGVVLFDLADEASAGLGAVVAIGAAIVVAGCCGDYRVFRGASLFPSLDE